MAEMCRLMTDRVVVIVYRCKPLERRQIVQSAIDLYGSKTCETGATIAAAIIEVVDVAILKSTKRTAAKVQAAIPY